MFADVRFAVGYNFTTATEPDGILLVRPRGFYFTISTKLSNLFDLFGTAGEGLAPSTETNTPPTKQEKPQVDPAQGEKKP